MIARMVTAAARIIPRTNGSLAGSVFGATRPPRQIDVTGLLEGRIGGDV
jgi:hypothetical protein